MPYNTRGNSKQTVGEQVWDLMTQRYISGALLKTHFGSLVDEARFAATSRQLFTSTPTTYGPWQMHYWLRRALTPVRSSILSLESRHPSVVSPRRRFRPCEWLEARTGRTN